jgi:hypothetical protein
MLANPFEERIVKTTWREYMIFGGVVPRQGYLEARGSREMRDH